MINLENASCKSSKRLSPQHVRKNKLSSLDDFLFIRACITLLHRLLRPTCSRDPLLALLQFLYLGTGTYNIYSNSYTVICLLLVQFLLHLVLGTCYPSPLLALVMTRISSVRLCIYSRASGGTSILPCRDGRRPLPRDGRVRV